MELWNEKYPFDNINEVEVFLLLSFVDESEVVYRLQELKFIDFRLKILFIFHSQNVIIYKNALVR